MSGLVDSTPNQNNSGDAVFESMSASPMANSISQKIAASANSVNLLNLDDSANSANLDESAVLAIPEGSEVSSESLNNNNMPVENLPPMDNHEPE